MDPNPNERSRAGLLIAVLVALAACESAKDSSHSPPTATLSSPSALELVLAPQPGEHALDQRIRRLQQRIPASRTRAEELERLGFTYIARARELGDPGSYQLALQCALAIEAQQPNSHAGLLLRGHALHSLHHFAEAEHIARRLVDERGLAFDFGLLGDILVDRGALDEATENYQRMMDLRPDSHALTRAAHVRYLKGDLAGALNAMQTAARAVSPRNHESFAWTWSKLAIYQLQAADVELAQSSARRALEVLPDSYPALRAQALIHLAKAEPQLAVTPLRAAAAHTPHPEVLWLLVDTLRWMGETAEAEAVRTRLMASGSREDPRAFALYLATQGKQLTEAERLALAELAERADAYSYEALAWVQSARGLHDQALQNARRSLAPGTEDPRLYYHAGLIAERAGDLQQSRTWLARANRAAHMLMPSQREQLATRVTTDPLADSDLQARRLARP